MNKPVFKTGRQAIEALPGSLRVGPFDFRIDKLSAQRAMGKDCFGEFSSCEGHLALQLDMPSCVKAADTMHLGIARLGEQRQTVKPFKLD